MPPRKFRSLSSKATPTNGCGKAPEGQRLGDAPTHLIAQGIKAALAELKLTYDSSLGVVMGDAIATIPAPARLALFRGQLKDILATFDSLSASDRETLKTLNSRSNQDDGPVASRLPGSSPDEAKAPLDHMEESKPETLLSAILPPCVTDPETSDVPPELVKPEHDRTPLLLPEGVAELGLYVPRDPPLEQSQLHAYLQEKYAVSQYPQTDLADQLCGRIPDIDLSHLKPANQVQFATFAAHIESYFRPFTEEDSAFLEKKMVLPPALASGGPNPHGSAGAGVSLSEAYDPSILPYVTPKLGRPYTEVWAAEGGTSLLSARSLTLDSHAAKGSIMEVLDETLDTDEVSVGALSSRLLSGLMGIEDVSESFEREEEEPEREICSSHIMVTDDDYAVAPGKPDYATLEQRLKRELKYMGIFQNQADPDDKTKKKDEALEDLWLEEREDDEVCMELRKLQGQLKAAVRINNSRKRKLVAIVEEQIAWQEFTSISDDLDKQIDQAYLKRVKVPKLKKRKLAPMHQTPTAIAHAVAKLAHEQAANSGMRALIEKKNRWVKQIGPLFRSNELMRRQPTESVFEDLIEEDEEDEEEGGLDVEAM